MLPLWSVASEQCGEVSVAQTDRAGRREPGDARRMEGETMTAKRKRPKVRYVADMVLNVERTLPGMVCDRNGRVVAHYCTWAYASPPRSTCTKP